MRLQLLKEPRVLKPWVDVDATISKFGYDPRWFKPNSFRTVVCKCTSCGLSRDNDLRGAELHPLCLLCSNRKNAKTNTEIRIQRIKEHWAEFGHPRIGKKHTLETREKIRRNRKPHRMPDWQRRGFSVRFSGTGNPFYGRTHANSNIKRGPESWRYGKLIPHAHKVWYTKDDGSQVCFRSRWEARVAGYLDSHGIAWEYETKVFPVHYEWAGKEKQSTYRSDFWLVKDNTFIEVKGLWRPESIVKFNALKEQYVNLKISVWDRAILKERGIHTGKPKSKSLCLRCK